MTTDNKIILAAVIGTIIPLITVGAILKLDIDPQIADNSTRVADFAQVTDDIAEDLKELKDKIAKIEQDIRPEYDYTVYLLTPEGKEHLKWEFTTKEHVEIMKFGTGHRFVVVGDGILNSKATAIDNWRLEIEKERSK